MPYIVKHFTAVLHQSTDTKCYLHHVLCWNAWAKFHICPFFSSVKECYSRIKGIHPREWPRCLTSHASGCFNFLDCGSGSNIYSLSCLFLPLKICGKRSLSAKQCSLEMSCNKTWKRITTWTKTYIIWLGPVCIGVVSAMLFYGILGSCFSLATTAVELVFYPPSLYLLHLICLLLKWVYVYLTCKLKSF